MKADIIKGYIITALIMFIVGWSLNGIYSKHIIESNNPTTNQNRLGEKEKPANIEETILREKLVNTQIVPKQIDISSIKDKDVPSPYNWIKQEQIKVYDNKVIIEIDNPRWSRFTNTKSMDPIIDKESNAIEIIPESEEDIHVGDIVAYKSEYSEGTLIHRVVIKDEDEKGVFFKLKGDNNPKEDPGKVRFEQIERVVVAIMY